MAKNKACKICKTIYEGEKCSNCDSKEGIETFKGRIVVFDAEKSEIAKEIGIKEKGNFAIKVR